MKPTDPEQLEHIPGIGKSLAEDLRAIGIQRTSDLRGKNPEELYKRSNEYAGVVQDPCVLYTFRCAVYFANGGREKKKLLWWNWK
ncbi:MAG: helix-hairpin-helix domain-containing protein [Candidatus Kerfeldbacteria bacterium]|nr:helix-hairpin-helix domain-containing protein [Candidatus Kerfeldbacteria bacterium]